MRDPLQAWRFRFSSSRRERLLRVAPSIIYMVGIVSMSSVSGPKVPVVVDDGIAHFFEYFGLTLVLLFTAAGFADSDPTWRRYLGVGSFSSLFAATDEFHQRFVPGRDASLDDLFWDVTGTAACIGVMWLLLRRRGKR